MSDEDKRALKIKSNSVKRIAKELSYYYVEKDKEQARLDKMKSEGADEHDVKQQMGVVTESEMMIPEVRKHLESSLQELKTFIAGGVEGLEGTEEMEKAKENMQQAEEAMKVSG